MSERIITYAEYASVTAWRGELMRLYPLLEEVADPDACAWSSVPAFQAEALRLVVAGVTEIDARTRARRCLPFGTLVEWAQLVQDQLAEIADIAKDWMAQGGQL